MPKTIPDQTDKFKDKCGVVGIFGTKESAPLAYLALHALQHRGQDSAGIVTQHKNNLKREVGSGLVSDVFNEKNLKKLKGKVAIGHVRYTTAGTSDLKDAQPIACKTANGQIAVAHNGNLVNAQFLRKKLEQDGAIFHGESDTEVICHLFAHSQHKDVVSCLRDALEKVKGAYSLCLIVDGKLYAARDPHGVRPLFLGKLQQGYVVASEDCAFTLMDAQFVREINPGEIICVDKEGVKSFDLIGKDKNQSACCVFEQIYFARPDSHVFGSSVYSTRKALGAELAKICPVDADVVIAVPDSGVLAAMGYAAYAKIPYDNGLVRNHYVGRTFIEPQSRIRHFGVRLKLSPVLEVVQNKRLIVVDDSIVRGTTSKKIVALLKQAGAKEIHMRISAPMTKFPCTYGIATPTKEELIASNKTRLEIEKYLDVDSLAYLTTEAMYKAVNQKQKMCDACFTGKYPI